MGKKISARNSHAVELDFEPKLFQFCILVCSFKLLYTQKIQCLGLYC